MLWMGICKAFGGYGNFVGGDRSERLTFSHPPRSLQKDSRGTCLPRRRGFFVFTRRDWRESGFSGIEVRLYR